LQVEKLTKFHVDYLFVFSTLKDQFFNTYFGNLKF